MKALIIKYSPTGTQLWSYRFKINNSFHASYDIVTDLTGNVYVTGEYGPANIFLVKFYPSGALVNQTSYDLVSEGARKIGMDGAGKIIIAGYIQDNDSL